MAAFVTIACIAAAVVIVLRSAAISTHHSAMMLDKYDELLKESREMQIRRLTAQDELELLGNKKTKPHR